MVTIWLLCFLIFFDMLKFLQQIYWKALLFWMMSVKMKTDINQFILALFFKV